MMNYSRKSFVISTSLFFGGFAVLFYGLYQREIEKDLLPSGTEVIGKIVQAEMDVARRPNSRLLWSRLESGATLYKKDTIRTGPGSKVLVKLNQNSSIALGENTLVVLETENESFNLKLADGDVEFSGNITVALDSKTKLRAVDGTLRLKRDSGTGKDKVAAVTGKAEVLSESGVAIVDSGEVLVKGQEGAFKVSGESLEDAGLNELGVKEIESLEDETITLKTNLNKLSPKAAIVRDEGISKLKISWNPVKEASKYELKFGNEVISTIDDSMMVVPQDLVDHINKEISVKAISAKINGDEQNVVLDQKTKDMIIALGSSSKLVYPFDGSRVLVQKKVVKLKWNSQAEQHSDFLYYNLKVTIPKGKIREFRSKVSTFDMELEGSGSYAWSVQPVFDDYGLGLLSTSSKFEAIGGAPLMAPDVSPASEVD